MKTGIALVVLLGSACLASAAEDMPAGHHHGTVELTDKSNLPSLGLDVQRDSMSGWNIHIPTSNFRFAPEHVGQSAQAGEGHAHLYVDGNKVARLYGPWFHLEPQAPGQHQLRVTLNANSHDELAVDGKTIDATAEIVQ